MIKRVFAILFLLCLTVKAQYTITINSQGAIVAPVTAAQFAAVNGLGGSGPGGVLYSNVYGLAAGVFAYISGTNLVIISTNTVGGGGGGNSNYFIPGTNIYIAVISGPTGVTNIISLSNTIIANVIGNGAGITNIFVTSLSTNGLNAGTNYALVNTGSGMSVVQVTSSGGGPGGVLVTNVTGLVSGLYAYISGTNLVILSTNGVAPGTDSRQLYDASTKAVVTSPGVPYVIFTNASACTVTDVRMDYAFGSTNIRQPVITFYANGATNFVPCAGLTGIQIPSFFAQQGNPKSFFGSDLNTGIDCAIDICQSATPLGTVPLWTNFTISGDRPLAMNSSSNASITVTFYNAEVIYADVNYRLGNPVTSNTWHAIENQALIGASNGPSGTVFTIAAVTNVFGYLESVSMFELANGGQTYLETKPTIYFNGIIQFITANGTEDFFGGTFYWNYGYSTYATPRWGAQSEVYNLHCLYTNTDGHMAYRFFNGAWFQASGGSTPSFLFNVTNIFTGAISNCSLVTYYSYP